MKHIHSIPVILLALATLSSCTDFKEVKVSNITLNSKAVTLEIGQTAKLIATVSPQDATNTTIIWSSDNTSVVLVSKDGTVTAVAPGTAKITVKSDDGGISDSCVVTVLSASVTGVSLDQESITLREGESYKLNATITPSNVDYPSLQWSSSNTEVVQVTAEGILLALKPGTSDITVTTVDGGYTATCKVTVKDKVTGLSLEPSKMDIIVGDEADVIARLEPEDANVKVTWQSANPDIVSVDGNGHIKALAVGDAIISATTDYKGLQSFCSIHVRNKVESLTLSFTSAEAYLGGDPTQLTATITPADLPDLKIIWFSSDTSIATVDNKGAVTAKKKGTVTITVTVENGSQIVSQSCEISVIQPVTSISVTPATLEMFVDEVLEISKVLTIKTEPADADDTSCKYTTSSAGIISVLSGKITAKKAGTVTLYVTPTKASSTTLKAQCKITVKARGASITVTPSEKTMQVGQTYTLTAKVLPNEASQEVTWSSSDTKVATVENGKVTAVKAGEAVITATSKDNAEIKATCAITVVNIPVESVTLNKTSLTLLEGTSETLTATVKPENVADKTVTWTSSNESIAMVTSAGKVIAVKTGSVTITASCGGKSATCKVTVTTSSVSVTGVSLNKTSMTLTEGETQTLTATVSPSNATNTSVTWSSNNTSVATVSSSGVVTAIKAGSATITVRTGDGGKTATCSVTVKSKDVSGGNEGTTEEDLF